MKDGEEEPIVQATEECSDEEWKLLCESLDVATGDWLSSIPDRKCGAEHQSCYHSDLVMSGAGDQADEVQTCTYRGGA